MKKIIALLLAIFMVVGMFPTTVLAAETDPAISFSTTFAETMTVGDTFTVTADLANNPGIAAMTLSLKWNDAVVKFTGFEKYEDDFPVSEVLEARGWTVIPNHELGILVSYRTTNNSDNGSLFTANFEIVGYGDAEIGLKMDDITEYEVVNENSEPVELALDFSAVEGLTVAAPVEPECDHSYVAGVCSLCGEADPDYVAPSATVYLSLSSDDMYMVGRDTGEVMAFKEITVPYFDLGLYGLEEYYFITETYGDDGDGLPGSDLTPGTPEFADGKVTLMHLYLYALEVYYCGVDEADAGKGYLYNEGLIGTDVFNVSGGVGSSFMNQFWGGDCNLNYYVNYEYPEASPGWGATADQILLRDGDIVTLGHFTGWSFYGDTYSIFNYILADKSAATQGEEVKLTLMYAGANLGFTDGTAQNLNPYCLDVYCTPANAVTSEDVTSWTYLGTSDENGELVVDTADLAPGKYIVAVAGQYGVDYPDEICSTPGGVILTVNACSHNYVDGVCGTCGAADPDYVAPANDYVFYTNESGLVMPGDYDIAITELNIADAKDKIIAVHVDRSGENNRTPLLATTTFLDSTVKDGDAFTIGYKAVGDDADGVIVVPESIVIGEEWSGIAQNTMRIYNPAKANSIEVTYNFRIVTSFGLNKSEVTLDPAQEETLSVSTNLAAYLNTKLAECVEWTSSNTAVATVEGGKVVAVAPGTATITATVGTKTATCEVIVAEPESNNYVIWSGELSNQSSNLDLYVTEWYIEDGKDFVLGSVTTYEYLPGGNTTTATIVDGDQIKVGSKINLGYTVAGDDADQINSVSGNVATIQSYGYYMDQLRVTPTDYYTISNRFDIYPLSKYELSDVTMVVGEDATLTLALDSHFDNWSTGYVNQLTEWTSSDESVVTVEGGKLTAKGLGTATITAKIGNENISKTATCTVTVESNNATVWTGELSHGSSNLDLYVTEFYIEDGKSFVLGSLTTYEYLQGGNIQTATIVDGDQIKVGSKINLGYTVAGDDADQINSVSGNVATIQSYGYYMDQLRITQSDYYSITNRFDIYPLSKYELADVQVEPGTETALTLSLDSHFDRWSTDHVNQLTEWTSSDESVVTVEGGVLTAKGIGTATITAKIGNDNVSKTATCTVTVACNHDYFNGICTKCSEADPDYVAIETIQLTSPSLETQTDETTGETVSVLKLTAGGSEKLTAVLNEGATQGVIWTSENEGVAKVDENGVVTAVSSGTTVITATAGDTAKTFAARSNPVMASVTVTVEEMPEGDYYIVTMAEDKTVVAGETIEIPVTVGHSAYLGYNAWDMTFTYDSSALKLTTESSGDTFSVTVDGNTIRVQGYGADMEAGTAAFNLTFEALKAATSELTLNSAKVDNAGHAIGNDAPEATVNDGLTVLTVTGYPVTLPEGFEGEGVAAPGKDYTFSAPEDYYDYTVEIKVNGETVTVEPVDGTWTIPGESVTGDIVITQTDKTGKSFDVTLGEYMSGEPTAQHGAPYSATLNKEAGYTYSVTVKIGGETYTGAEISGDTYTIPGGDITGEIEFVVTRDVVASTDLTVTFSGSGAGAAEGNATTVKNGEDYVFTLTMAKGYTYTVMVNGEEVAPNAEGKYVIEKVTSALTIEIEKTLDLAGKVSVNEYVNLDGKTVFLVLVDGELDDGNYYTYDGNAMYYSFVYEAWATLTVVEGAFTADDAAAKVDAAAGAKMTISSANGDVNNTGTVDINDAQLAYDVYQGKYEDIADIGMAKYLWADVNGDGKVDVTDAQSVVAVIK